MALEMAPTLILAIDHLETACNRNRHPSHPSLRKKTSSATEWDRRRRIRLDRQATRKRRTSKLRMAFSSSQPAFEPSPNPKSHADPPLVLLHAIGQRSGRRGEGVRSKEDCAYESRAIRRPPYTVASTASSKPPPTPAPPHRLRARKSRWRLARPRTNTPPLSSAPDRPHGHETWRVVWLRVNPPHAVSSVALTSTEHLIGTAHPLLGC